MKLFRDIILETATPEEIQIAQQRLTREFKDLSRIKEPVRLNLLATEIRNIRLERNQERINNILVNEYGISPEIGRKLKEKLDKMNELYQRISGEISSLKFQVNINIVDREKGMKELGILESKLERVKRTKMALENAIFHYNGLVEKIKDALQEEIELKELYP
jgi:hypothetical protein